MKNFLVLIPAEGIPAHPRLLQDGYEKDEMLLHGFEEIEYQNKKYDVRVDGEIYNISSIQAALDEAGYPVADSLEALCLYAYLCWGNEAMRQLEGAYSLTIKVEDTLLCFKDPLGLKPIFYLENKEGIWISNRIKTLLDNSGESAILDEEGILELFTFGPSISEDKTLFKHIYALPMGSCLSVHQHNKSIEQYYQMPTLPHTDDLETTIQKVHDLVASSIAAQSKDCGASFLSGGLDSSIITSQCAHDEKWHSYSLDYEGNNENFTGNLYQVSLDASFIQEMCSFCGQDHTYLEITQKELLDLLSEAMRARDQPGMADVDSSLLWLCQQVGKKEDTILSGECADEIFGGYPWFYRDELKDLDTFPWLRSSEQRMQLIHKDLQSLDYAGYMKTQYDKTINQIEYLATDSEEDKRARLHTNLCLHWFMQTLVTRQGCMGNATNVTIRAPFANVKVLEYVYNIPWNLKFLDGEEKGILRKAFEQELPASVAHRKKNPFPKTHNPQYAELIAKLLQERFDDATSPLHQLFDDEKLQELIDTKGTSFSQPWYGQLMSGPQLLAYIYQIDQWILLYDIRIEKTSRT